MHSALLMTDKNVVKTVSVVIQFVIDRKNRTAGISEHGVSAFFEQ